MNIAFLAIKNPYRGGGIEKYTLELGSRLVQRGHDVTVYSMTHYGEIPEYVSGMKIIPVPSFKTSYLQKVSASFSAALSAARHGPYDIVHLHSVASGAFGFFPRIRGMKTVLQMHGIEWKRSRWGGSGSTVLRFLESCSVHQANAITAVSKQQCDYLSNQYGRDIEYIPTATQIEEIIPPNEILNLGLRKENYVLFASRLVSEKGAHYLVQAYRNVRSDMKLVIAGSLDLDFSYKNKLMKLAEGDDRIIFTGHVEGRLLKELFSNAYLYVQSSTIEGLSIALLEAMGFGRCCLVSDIPENLEPLDGNGFSFQSENVDDLTEKLQHLIDDPQKVKDVGMNAVEKVRTEYTWDVVTDKMESFYTRTLSIE